MLIALHNSNLPSLSLMPARQVTLILGALRSSIISFTPWTILTTQTKLRVSFSY